MFNSTKWIVLGNRLPSLKLSPFLSFITESIRCVVCADVITQTSFLQSSNDIIGMSEISNITPYHNQWNQWYNWTIKWLEVKSLKEIYSFLLSVRIAGSDKFKILIKINRSAINCPITHYLFNAANGLCGVCFIKEQDCNDVISILIAILRCGFLGFLNFWNNVLFRSTTMDLSNLN